MWNGSEKTHAISRDAKGLRTTTNTGTMFIFKEGENFAGGLYLEPADIASNIEKAKKESILSVL